MSPAGRDVKETFGKRRPLIEKCSLEMLIPGAFHRIEGHFDETPLESLLQTSQKMLSSVIWFQVLRIIENLGIDRCLLRQI